jgi:Ca2+-binding RTX toxin-like protein
LVAFASGTDANDLFTATEEELAGGVLDGRGGNDTLRLLGGSTFDLTTLQAFASIETVQGSAGHDTIILSAEQAAGVVSFDGGASPLTHRDELQLVGGAFDFSSKTLTGIDRISLQTDGAVLTVGSVNAALLASGLVSQNDRLVAAGVTFTPDQIALLHRQGIDTIVDAAGPHTNLAPATDHLDGDRFEAKAGEQVFVDRGRNAVLSEDDGLLALLKVEAPVGLSAPGRLRIDLSGTVALEGGYTAGSTVRVGGIDIGMLWDASDAGLSVIFNANATPTRVQEILRSLTYTMSDQVPETSTQQQIVVTLTDEGGRRSASTVRIDQIVKVEPPQLTLSHVAVPELSPGGTLVGLLTVKAPGPGGFTYTLRDSAGGRFVLDGDRLLVASGAGLDFESHGTHEVVVRATGADGTVIDQSFSIAITDVQDEVIVWTDGSVTGTDGSDTLTGGRGRDKLAGGFGDDVLYGKEGHDSLEGGAGRDVFVFDTKSNARTNVDRIGDFVPKVDRLFLDNKVFKALGAKGSLTKPEKLHASKFWKGAKAHDESDRLIYNPKNGVLLYDPDGTGKTAAVKIAVLSTKLALGAKDFFVI